MAAYIDIHSHILPCVDDGSDSFEMSMKMLRLAAKNGISSIILTPHNKPAHHNAEPEEIALKTKKLQNALVEEKINLKLYAGNELYYRSGVLEELENGYALTLADSLYVLVEFNPSDDYDYIRNGIYSLLMTGYRPILAHAERYRNVCVKKNGVYDLAEMGCYIQVNAGSIMGEYGFGTRQFTKKILNQHLVHFVATDAHDLDKRVPQLANCAKFVAKKFGEDYGKELFYENPLRVLQNQYITN